jgi:hypothetical protein
MPRIEHTPRVSDSVSRRDADQPLDAEVEMHATETSVAQSANLLATDNTVLLIYEPRTQVTIDCYKRA